MDERWSVKIVNLDSGEESEHRFLPKGLDLIQGTVEELPRWYVWQIRRPDGSVYCEREA